MAGTVKVNSVQLGDSATASQNLTIVTNLDGTFKLARGNVGATTQDILTIDANGRIAQPQTVVAFRATLSANQSISASTQTKVALNTVTYDTTSCFNAANNRFIPQVPGYYLVNGQMASTVASSALVALIVKSGTTMITNYIQATLSPSSYNVSDIVYMNGTTDYLELWGQINGTSPAFAASNIAFSGILIAKA